MYWSSSCKTVLLVPSTDSEKTILTNLNLNRAAHSETLGCREERSCFLASRKNPLVPETFTKSNCDRETLQDQHVSTRSNLALKSNLEGPPRLEDLEPFHEYHENYTNKPSVINNINRDPREFDTSKPCLICKKPGHTFNKCPMLNNVSQLKKHYISWKMFLARATRQQEEIWATMDPDRRRVPSFP